MMAEFVSRSTRALRPWPLVTKPYAIRMFKASRTETCAAPNSRAQRLSTIFSPGASLPARMASRSWTAKLSFNKPELAGAATRVGDPVCEPSGMLLNVDILDFVDVASSTTVKITVLGPVVVLCRPVRDRWVHCALRTRSFPTRAQPYGLSSGREASHRWRLHELMIELHRASLGRGTHRLSPVTPRK